MQKISNSNKKENTHKPYSLKGGLVKKEILGVGITNDTKENILEFIHQSIEKSSKPYYIVTPNPEMIVRAHRDNEFRSALNNAKLALNDGVGVGLAARIMGVSLKDRFTGVDLVEKMCEKCNDWPITVGFLGAGPNVAEKAAECLKSRYPQLKVVFASDQWPGGEFVFFPKESRSMNHELRKRNQKDKTIIHNSKFIIPHIDVLFVAYGAPKQEFWMVEHVGKIPVKVMVGVGGALDQIAGVVPRAPDVVRRLGFEWLFRLIIQPWRWKRQLALVEFIGMAVSEMCLYGQGAGGFL